MQWNVYIERYVGGQSSYRYLCSVNADNDGDAKAVASASSAGGIAVTSLAAWIDELDPYTATWPEWAPRFIDLNTPKMGRPSQGRSYRLQAAITPDQMAWLESQRQPEDKGVSDVVYRLLEQSRKQSL